VVGQPWRYGRCPELRRSISKSSAHFAPSMRPVIDYPSVSDRMKTKPTEHLEEEFPGVAAFLRSISNPDQGLAQNDRQIIPEQPSQHAQDVASEFLTSGLLSTVQGIMERSERDGTDPDEELRVAVSRTVLEGVAAGVDLSDAANTTRQEDNRRDGVKRPRIDKGPDAGH
jgi:hypothetical protein